MTWKHLRQRVSRLLEQADIRLDGDRPWDPVVHDERLFPRVMAKGTLGLGEAYVDGWWDCQALDELATRAIAARIDEQFHSLTGLRDSLLARMTNLQKPSRAREIGRDHYDLGNDLFAAMLDERLIYSCGYWQAADGLEEAQEAKLDLVANKLDMKPGMRLLDIGCGWGGTAKFLAERYQAEVVGITVSEKQARLARELCKGLPVTILVQDYREVSGRFDRILSIGMFEHVGYKNYRHFMHVAHDLLEADGLMLLHTIGRNRSSVNLEPWMARYIFPNSMLPSPRQVTSAFENLFVLEDWHNFGADYDKTLMAWDRRFEAAWPALAPRYGERFFRIWRYYLLTCAGSFRSGANRLWQLVLSTGGVPGGYRSLR